MSATPERRPDVVVETVEQSEFGPYRLRIVYTDDPQVERDWCAAIDLLGQMAEKSERKARAAA